MATWSFGVAAARGVAPMFLRDVGPVRAVADDCGVGKVGPPTPPGRDAKPWFCVAGRRGMLAVLHGRRVCCFTQQTCMSAVSRSRHVCRGTQQACLLCHIADASTVSRSRHVFCVPQRTCLQ